MSTLVVYNKYVIEKTEIEILSVKSYCRLNWLVGSTFNFERLNILPHSIRHLSKKLLSFELAHRFNIQFRESRYIKGLNQKSE